MVSLFVSNGASFAVVGLSYLVYSRILAPAQFGLYSAALVVGAVGTVLLDGGLKTALIKSAHELNRAERVTITALMLAFSVLLSAGLALAGRPIEHFVPGARADYAFLAEFGAIYLLTYPLISIPTAILERRLDYPRLAWIEAAGVVFERAVPALMLLMGMGMSAFLLGLLIGRVARVASLNILSPLPLVAPSARSLRIGKTLIQEGLWLQMATGASAIRDSLHVLLVGPLFGKDWVGYYGWGLQLNLIGSQAFVQVSARVSVPVFARSEGFERKWHGCLRQVRTLAILTVPVLAMILIAIPTVNRVFFASKWTAALAILPLLFLRMLPGLATTPLGSLVMVHRGGRAYATVMVLWTIVEIAAAWMLLRMIGPTGLAWSYAIVVWVGVLLLTTALNQPFGRLSREILTAVLKRPSLVVAAGGVLVAINVGAALPRTATFVVPIVAVVTVVGSYLSEPALRAQLASRRWLPWGPSVIEQAT